MWRGAAAPLAPDYRFAAAGDRAAMTEVVMGSTRHILSTTLTTVGGFLPLILAGGGFWPPFAMAVAGGVALSTVLAFAFTPQMFALVHRRMPMPPVASADSPLPAPEGRLQDATRSAD